MKNSTLDFILRTLYHNLFEQILIKAGIQWVARHFGHKATLAEMAEKEIPLVVQKTKEAIKGIGPPLSLKLGTQRRWKS